jgi:hypothetical protein
VLSVVRWTFAMSESQASTGLDERFFDVSPTLQRAYAITRSATRTPAPSSQITSLTIDATRRIHLNFHSCLGSAQAARRPSTSPPPLRAINRALLPPHRRSLFHCSPSAPSPSCNHPSCLPHSIAHFPHDASRPQEMSSLHFPPTTARPRARDW